MRKSRILVIIILIITLCLGGVAIWIGMRLGKEEEVTPEESEAWSAPDGSCHPPADCNYNNYNDCDALNDESTVPTNASWYFTNCNSDCPGWEGMEIWVFVCRGPMSNEKCEFCSGGGCNMTPIPDGGCESGGNYCVDNSCGQDDNPCHCCYDTRISAWNQDCLNDCIDSSPGYDSSGYGDLTPEGTFDGTDYNCRNIQVDAVYGGVGAMVMRCQKNPSGVWEDHDDNVSWTFDDCQQMQQDFSCDSLLASPSVLTTDGGDITLTTEATATNVTIIDYDYGADINGEVITDGSSTSTWTIPASTDSGEYHAWVSVAASGLSAAGCSGVDDCTTGDEECQVTINVQDEAVPDFDAEKEASVSCINNNTAAEVTYTITVTNVSTVSGTVLSVSDTYDSRFQRSWIDSSSIDPSPDSWEGNVITWNNGGEGWTLEAGGELEFTYVVTVPSEYFGEYNDDGSYDPYQYENFALVRTEVEDIELESTVEIVCIVETGIFDNAVWASLIALLMIVIGTVYIRYNQEVNILLNTTSRIWPISLVVEKFNYDRKKEKFEKKTLKKATKRNK